jgi:hypothetical protein
MNPSIIGFAIVLPIVCAAILLGTVIYSKKSDVKRGTRITAIQREERKRVKDAEARKAAMKTTMKADEPEVPKEPNVDGGEQSRVEQPV